MYGIAPSGDDFEDLQYQRQFVRAALEVVVLPGVGGRGRRRHGTARRTLVVSSGLGRLGCGGATGHLVNHGGRVVVHGVTEVGLLAIPDLALQFGTKLKLGPKFAQAGVAHDDHQ